jgi:tRNA G10  N-methylase Trm11
MLKTVFDNQGQLLNEMVHFYSAGRIGLDPTYGNGCFYKKTNLVLGLYGDIKLPGKHFMDARKLPFPSDSQTSIMFDPPFLPGASPKKTGIINNRFGWFRTIKDVWDMYEGSLREFSRVVKRNGILYFKCQDTCNCNKQWWSHVWIINKAEELGLHLEDLFILVAKNRLTDNRWKTQRHARKFHSYFLVFRK